MFCKIDTIKNFVKFTGKHLSRSHLFNKAASLSSATLLKKESGTSVTSKFYKICEDVFYAEDHRNMGENIKNYKRRLPLDSIEQLVPSSKRKMR